MWPVTLLKICLLRANPQDLPSSSRLTALALVVYYVTDVVMAFITVSFTRALLFAALDTFLLAALAHTALSLRHFGVRLRQTLMALAGCGVLLAIPALIAMGWIGATLPPAVWAPLLLWSVAVYGHILRHALEVRYAHGIAAACVYVFVALVATGPFLMTPETN